MEYAAGGELFERICTAGRFSEDEVVISFFTHLLNSWWFDEFQEAFLINTMFDDHTFLCFWVYVGKIFLSAANLWS